MQNIARYVSILYRKSLVYFNTVSEEFGITAAEQPLLMLLYKMNGASQEELSAVLMIDKAATARITESLVKKGYICKEKDPQDKRASRLFLTERTMSLQERFIEQANEWNSFLLEGESPEDIETLLRLLERMSEKIRVTDIKERWSCNGDS